MLPKSYLDDVIARFEELRRLADGAIAQLKPEQLFQTWDKESNSIAIIMKHIAGNMQSRWRDFLTTDGEKPDRFRDTEFEVLSSDTLESLNQKWQAGWNYLFEALKGLTPELLNQTVLIRNEPHFVYQAINRQLLHYGMHIGQIVFMAKHLASDHWKSLSIPRGQSQVFNRGRGLP
jgi:Protein of unknown function (DUF1572)